MVVSSFRVRRALQLLSVLPLLWPKGLADARSAQEFKQASAVAGTAAPAEAASSDEKHEFDKDEVAKMHVWYCGLDNNKAEKGPCVAATMKDKEEASRQMSTKKYRKEVDEMLNGWCITMGNMAHHGVCTHWGLNRRVRVPTDRHADRQTDRQTDRQAAHTHQR